jgi:heme/copper-type cytochrome/quinol oxidase subunit 2
MSTYPIIAITIAVTVVALLAVAFVVYRRKREFPEPDYRVFFILGITWLPLGIATDNPAFWGMGAVFLIAGLANRNKWKEAKNWSDLPSSERNMRLLSVVVGLVIVLALALAVYFMARS